MDDWNTDWDPYEALRTAEHNIAECVRAINQGSEIMKELANKYNHQQEVIQQLMFQNRKLNQLIGQLRMEVETIRVKANQ